MRRFLFGHFFIKRIFPDISAAFWPALVLRAACERDKV
jgi:hypothetical protein